MDVMVVGVKGDVLRRSSTSWRVVKMRATEPPKLRNQVMKDSWPVDLFCSHKSMARR
jgi:hypothetical protein